MWVEATETPPHSAFVSPSSVNSCHAAHFSTYSPALHHNAVQRPGGTRWGRLAVTSVEYVDNLEGSGGGRVVSSRGVKGGCEM